MAPAPPALDTSEVKSLSRLQLFATPWTVAPQAPLSVEYPIWPIPTLLVLFMSVPCLLPS